MIALLPLTALASLLLLSLSLVSVVYAADEACPPLKTRLQYQQANSPADISSVLRVVVERVNRELEGVIDVDVEWTGSELHRKVGKYGIKTRVTRTKASASDDDSGAQDNSPITECFTIPFIIEDTNECELPMGHDMRHSCHESSKCVNTEGGYECRCEGEGLWGRSLKAASCPLSPSTEGCCSAADSECRSNFVCPVNPCGLDGGNDCDSSKGATCRSSVYEDGSGVEYSCLCPEGLLGSGRLCSSSDVVPQPKVGFDGKPTADTVASNFCSCTKPAVDQCAGFPTCEKKNAVCMTRPDGSKPSCQCKPGYLDTEAHGCVDETPPNLKLRCDPDGDGVTRLKQGDNYEECAVDIEDANAEDLARTLKITYSDPLPSGCLRKMGQFHVNYTVATPWTEPPFHTVTRTVEVGDLNECSISPQQESHYCPEVLPRCDVASGAICKNTEGSYTCECPKCTTGDGFLPISGVKPNDSSSPVNYSGGNGCVDNCKPTIELHGPNPKVFRACKCGGLLGMTKDARTLDKKDSADGNFDADVKALIRVSAGAELCATKENKDSVTSASCATALDHTHNGVVDLTAQIQVGDPIKHSSAKNSWRVPYNVMDKAGNRAQTVWRDVVVEELTLEELEAVMREEFEEEKKKAVDEAVAKAVKRERADCDGQKRRLEAELTSTEGGGSGGAARNKNNNRGRCPKCESCPPPPACGEDDHKSDKTLANDLRACKASLANSERRVAEVRGGHDDSPGIMATLDDLFPLFLMLIIGCSSIGMIALFIQRAKGVFSGGSGNKGGSGNGDRAAQLAKSVHYHSPRHGTGGGVVGGASGTPQTPGSGRSTQQSPLFGNINGNGSGVFSPSGSVGSVQNSPPYTLSPITPSRTTRRSAR